MSHEDAIRVEGAVVLALPNTLFRVELANGHRVQAHLSRPLKMDAARPALGDRVILEMSPFDMSKGRIVERK